MRRRYVPPILENFSAERSAEKLEEIPNVKPGKSKKARKKREKKSRVVIGSDGAVDVVSTIGSLKSRKPAKRALFRSAYVQEARSRVEAENFEGVKPSIMVAIYCLCHEKVYGQWPIDLDDDVEWRLAMFTVKRLADKYFPASSVPMVEFLVWAWDREKDTERWRQANGRESKRLVWRWLFSARMVAEYRLNRERPATNSIDGSAS